MEELNRERADQVRALYSNSAFDESKENVEERHKRIEQINSYFNDKIMKTRDPHKHERELKAMRNDPLVAASMRNLDRLRWEFE